MRLTAGGLEDKLQEAADSIEPTQNMTSRVSPFVSFPSLNCFLSSSATWCLIVLKSHLFVDFFQKYHPTWTTWLYHTPWLLLCDKAGVYCAVVMLKPSTTVDTGAEFKCPHFTALVDFVETFVGSLPVLGAVIRGTSSWHTADFQRGYIRYTDVTP